MGNLQGDLTSFRGHAYIGPLNCVCVLGGGGCSLERTM